MPRDSGTWEGRERRAHGRALLAHPARRLTSSRSVVTPVVRPIGSLPGRERAVPGHLFAARLTPPLGAASRVLIPRLTPPPGKDAMRVLGDELERVTLRGLAERLASLLRRNHGSARSGHPSLAR